MTAAAPRPVVSRLPAQTVTATTHWAHTMGEKHGERDRAVSLQVQSRIDRDYERQAVCLQRWPAVVEAVRVLVQRYNEGTGLDTLTVIEDPVSPTITVVSATLDGGSLIMALDGAEVGVHTRNGQARTIGVARWVTLERSNEGTAEYLVRNWMEQL